jgi:chromosome segregation ATPase
MKALITKQDVVTAIEEIKASGRKPTIANIHAALGGRGSLTTVVKLKAEIEADGVAANDSAEGLQAFRDLWALAREEGRKTGAAEVAELRAGLDAMAVEAGRLEAEVETATRRVVEIESQRDSLVADLSQANGQLTTARASGEQSASKLAAALDTITRMQSDHLTRLEESAEALTECQARTQRLAVDFARVETERDGIAASLRAAEAREQRFVTDLREAREREQKLALELANSWRREMAANRPDTTSATSTTPARKKVRKVVDVSTGKGTS